MSYGPHTAIAWPCRSGGLMRSSTACDNGINAARRRSLQQAEEHQVWAPRAAPQDEIEEGAEIEEPRRASSGRLPAAADVGREAVIACSIVTPRPRSTPTHLRSARPLFRSPWFAPDSLLEESGFEPSVPLGEKRSFRNASIRELHRAAYQGGP